MAIGAGTRFGPYEIQSPLGAGGMGEVYKARDTRLDRTVAIKILPDTLSGDPQFRDRFEREARTISQLDHAHICALYDVGEERGTSFLVMQYLEGETLAARLQRGALPISDALKIAIQIAEALDKAHRAGVIHRDLKPGNVMLTKSGAKLLDFGLAKSTPVARGGMSMMPTTPVSITAQGTILGTFQYMAPEQVEGGEADARTDLFAFGAVLYEMVTGRPAFQGKTQASLIGSIMRDDPTLTADVGAALPQSLSRVIRTCLAKNPDDRFQTAHDVALQLQWILEGGSQVGIPAPVVVPATPVSRGVAWVPWSIAALAVIAAGGLAAKSLARTTPPGRIVRFEVANPDGIFNVGAPRLSPDGRYLAFNATDPTGNTKVWVRQLNSLTAQPLAGTDGASRPFWSPDSRFVGFMADGKLKKIDVSGGPAQKICDAPTGSDGSWSQEGVILFDGRGSDPIYRVPAAGGTPVVAVKADAGARGSASRMAGVSVRRQTFHVPRDEPEDRRLELSGRVDRFIRHADAGAGSDPAGVCAARPAAVCSRPDAGDADLRPQSDEDARRPNAAGGTHRHRRSGAGDLLDLSRRDARLSDRRSRQPARARRSNRSRAGDDG